MQGMLTEISSHQADTCLRIWKDVHRTGLSLEFPIQPFQNISEKYLSGESNCGKA